MSRHEAWSALRHSGNLLSPEALETLPNPGSEPRAVADRLRSCLALLDVSRPGGPTLSALLDIVLEELCGLRTGWRKGSALSAVETERLLDGTEWKPRRIWTGPDGETLHVFTTGVTRIGVGKGRRSASQVVEYLRRRRLPLGLLTNGVQWRLVWADTDSLAWVEWDSARWLDGDQLSLEGDTLRWLLSPGALLQQGADAAPLLMAIRATRRGQGQLSKELGERVRQAVETLLTSRRPVLEPVWDQHEQRNLYIAACRFVMRLVVIQFAEARELLPVDNPVYHQAYGLRSLLKQLDDQRTARQGQHTAWPRLLALVRLLHQGSPHPAMTVPAYGGDLFAPGDPQGDDVQRAQALLESVTDPPDDEAIHRLLVLLTRTTQRVREGALWRRVAAPVDFTELTSEYIGILYEGLLDYELHRAGEHPVLFLNLGDQPALPLDRLEAMDDKALKALVEKAKIKKQASTTEDEDESEDEPEDAADEEGLDEESEPVEAVEEALNEESTGADDERERARNRALEWACRAVVAGGLVRKARGKAAPSAEQLAKVREAAEQIVPKGQIKLPGELFLVRWGGTRKGAGTFYTRPQLTLPTVRRTLEPLMVDDQGALRPPEELLSLKVCDPAMGSGSFLVAALRVLTSTVVESLHVHGRITAVPERALVDCALLPEEDRVFPADGLEERLEALVRRAVVEHCIHGVDLDPLAVELARVALWVETLDRRLPFTFLDHKLRCGNALVGAWLDRFRDYPLLALKRQSPDEKWKGVHHTANQWHDQLKEIRKSAIAEQADLLRGQKKLAFAAPDDSSLQAAVGRVRELTAQLHAVPAGRPDERARLWRERIQHDPALEAVRLACDTWCALWFWPLDQLEHLPLPARLHAPGEDALAVVRDISRRQRFLHWELEFPDVFTQSGAGFDAVVGNPPWETLQPQSKEFFTNHDPLYRAYGKQEGLRIQQSLFGTKPAIEEEWLSYDGAFKDMANWLRQTAEPFGDIKDEQGRPGLMLLPKKKDDSNQLHEIWRRERAKLQGLADPAHPFHHQSEGKAYTYKMFVEAGYALLRVGGQLGLLTPSGIYTDKGSAGLRRLLLQGCQWRWLYSFENRDKIFDIHRSFKFCACVAQKGGSTQAIQSAFMRHDLEDWAEGRSVLELPAERIAAFSPKSLSILEIRSERDLAVLTKIYSNSVLLGDDGPNGWGIRYAQGDFNMTSDSHLFIGRDKAEEQGYKPDIYGRWVNAAGDVLLPLYEGRMIGQFDFSQKGWVSGKGRSAVWREIPWEEKHIEPQYLMRRSDFNSASTVTCQRSRLAFMEISSATNKRTCMATALPAVPCGHSAAVLFSDHAPEAIATLMDSWAYDHVARQRCGGLHMSYFVIEETPLFRPSLMTSQIVQVSSQLHCGHPMMAPLYVRSGSSRCRVALAHHERLRLRCQLDAVVALLYGLEREDFAWILKDCDHPVAQVGNHAFCRQLDPKGFWRVDKECEPELRHTVLSLVAFDDLQAAIAADGGDREAGISAFCEQNDGEGWMLPDTLCLAELGLTRTVDVGVYDERARQSQPVRSRLGERFLPWQLEQTPEECWAECERHARAIREGLRGPSAPPLGSGENPEDGPISGGPSGKSKGGRPKRTGNERQRDVFEGSDD